jgi:hypothetical protein
VLGASGMSQKEERPKAVFASDLSPAVVSLDFSD